MRINNILTTFDSERCSTLYGFLFLITVLLASIALGGCGSLNAKIATGLISSTVLGGRSPTNELEQTYYLGVFDPQDQLPPTIYRVRVHGQASFISVNSFASGWVPSEVVDSLATSISLDQGRVKIEKAGSDDFKMFKTGRRLMLFGPEGFREAPANHRLVIVMGSSPDKFFNAVDQSLGVIAQATQGSTDGELDKLLFQALTQTRSERNQMDELAQDIKTDSTSGAGAQ